MFRKMILVSLLFALASTIGMSFPQTAKADHDDWREHGGWGNGWHDNGYHRGWYRNNWNWNQGYYSPWGNNYNYGRRHAWYHRYNGYPY